ncbi:MAG: hypothetical protein DBX40_00945 [Clostridiales bacterium]|nr:MAG: hypothetical protein DBX40_00945 [Clostridiales bacterium]
MRQIKLYAVMGHKFTELIKTWLQTPEAERDYTVGALYLLKLSGNKIMYRNIISQIDRRHDVVEYQLQKYYNFRVQALTHAQVEEMSAQVKAIVAEHIPLAAAADEQPQKGKRADHDSLPDEIKAKFVENLSLLQRMRELHLRLRSLSLDNATCPDSERYPFLKELISLDKKLHANWEAYDHYVAPGPDAVPSRSAKAKRSAAGSKKKTSA